MRRALCFAVSACLIGGCNGLDRLTGGRAPPRDRGYDTSPVLSPVPRQEPYAVLDGYRSTGEKLYLVHWHGNTLDNVSLSQTDVDALDIPTYQN